MYRLHKLLKLVAGGNYLETAVRAAGFAHQTLYNWRRQAEAGNVAAIALVDALEKAQAEAEAEAVSDVRKAGKHPQFWAASMTRLERRHPDRWGRRQDDSSTPKVIVQIGATTSDVTVNIASLSPVPHSELDQLSTGQVEMLSPINGHSVTSIDSAPAAKALPAKRTGVTRRGNRRGAHKATAGA